jgi:ribosomal protein L7/L12
MLNSTAIIYLGRLANFHFVTELDVIGTVQVVAQLLISGTFCVAARGSIELAEDVDLEKHGRLISDEVFFGRRIRLYSKGFVRVGSAKSAPYEKLLGISGSADVSKKTALGRGIVAGMTMGTNLLVSPNKRGDVYLTIVTDRKTHALHQSPPGVKDIQAMHQIVTAGEAILKGQILSTYVQPVQSGSFAVSESKESGRSVEDLLARLQQLGDLHASGVVSDDEFSQLKEKIMGGLSPMPIVQDSLPDIHVDPAEEISADQIEEFDVILEESPDSISMKIQMIKEFRVLNPNVGLKEAKLATDNPPIVYANKIPNLQAQVIANQLEQFGAKVKIEISPSADYEQLNGTLSNVEVKISTDKVKIKNELPKY